MGGLEPENAELQVRTSLRNLNMEKADLFYLHAPDHETPIDKTLDAVQKLQSEGLFEHWGLSNYAAWQVVDIYHKCKARGIDPPAVYQGMYNATTRDVEPELFQALRYCGMAFYAYNPLAGERLPYRCHIALSGMSRHDVSLVVCIV